MSIPCCFSNTVASATTSHGYQERHQRLLAAARAELVAHGFLDASIQRICRQAGVGIGTYYSHFKGRQKEVLNTIVQAEFARFRAIENKNGTRAQLFELLGGAASEDAVRLRHIWHDVAFYRGPAAPDVEALWWKQIAQITGLIGKIRKRERIVDPMLSSREVAWLILL